MAKRATKNFIFLHRALSRPGTTTVELTELTPEKKLDYILTYLKSEKIYNKLFEVIAFDYMDNDWNLVYQALCFRLFTKSLAEEGILGRYGNAETHVMLQKLISNAITPFPENSRTAVLHHFAHLIVKIHEKQKNNFIEFVEEIKKKISHQIHDLELEDNYCQWNLISILFTCLMLIILGIGCYSIDLYSTYKTENLSVLEAVSPFAFGVMLSCMWSYLKLRKNKKNTLNEEMLQLMWLRDSADLATWIGDDDDDENATFNASEPKVFLDHVMTESDENKKLKKDDDVKQDLARFEIDDPTKVFRGLSQTQTSYVQCERSKEEDDDESDDRRISIALLTKNPISRYNEDYYCKIHEVKISSKRELKVRFEARGDNTLGELQNPEESVLISGQDTIQAFQLKTDKGKYNPESEIIGWLYYDISDFDRKATCIFRYGSGGYSEIKLFTLPKRVNVKNHKHPLYLVSDGKVNVANNISDQKWKCNICGDDGQEETKLASSSTSSSSSSSSPILSSSVHLHTHITRYRCAPCRFDMCSKCFDLYNTDSSSSLSSSSPTSPSDELDSKIELNNIDTKTPFAQLIEILGKNISIKSLSFKNCKIDDEEAYILARMLRNNNNLVRLDLSHNTIRSLGAAALADALRENTTLRILNLGQNEITDKGAEKVAESFKKAKSTNVWINLHGNRIKRIAFLKTIIKSKPRTDRNLVDDIIDAHVTRTNYAYDGLIVIIILFHCLVPGVVRSFKEVPFTGFTSSENFVSIAHIIVGLFGVPALFIICQRVNKEHLKIEKSMVFIGALMSPRKANELNYELKNRIKNTTCTLCLPERTNRNWNWFTNLSNGKQLDFWLKLRDCVRSRDPPTSLVIGVLLATDVTLFLTIFVRVVFLNRQVDIFNILGLVDAIGLAIPINMILYHILNTNSEIIEHHEELSKIRYTYALESAKIKTSQSQTIKDHLGISDLGQLEKVVTLLEAALFRLTHYDPQIKILGLVVDKKLIIQILSIMGTAAASGIGKLFSKIQQDGVTP